MALCDEHIDILGAVLQRRGWVSPGDLASCRDQLGPTPTADELLDLLVSRKAIDRMQARELRLENGERDEIAGYHILSRLGSGAMGTVYLAESPERVRVALKVISTKHVDDQEFIGRFNREADLVTQLDHPHIARALAAGRTEDGQPFLALEYVNGPSLADLLKTHGALPQDYVLRIGLQVAEGLHHAFSAVGLIHRDIKPENILLVKQGDGACDTPEPEDSARIIDFGLAKTIDSEQSLTMTGLTMGTPHYMSPEQICGKKDLDCRTDIYGLGCTMYHLLTGRTPFNGDSPGGIMMAHINNPIPDPGERVPSLHSRTRQLLAMAMAKERDRRYLNFQAFAQACREALEAIGAGQGQAVKLLRKPLVVNKPTPRKEASSDRCPRTPAAGTHSDQPRTGRTARHRDGKRLTPEPGPFDQADAGEAMAASRQQIGSAEAALRQAQTDRLRRGTGNSAAVARRTDRVATQAQRGGPGWLPLLALVLSLLLLVWVVFLG